MTPALLAALAGCAVGPPSLTVQVTDDAGNPVAQAEVTTWGAGEDPGACAEDAGTWTCPVATEGLVQVRARAFRWSDVTETVHVRGPTELALVLTPLTCLAVESPAVTADVEGSSGEALEEVAVVWQPSEGTAAPAPCSFVNERWECAYDHPGALTVTASAAGHGPQSTELFVDHDGCAPLAVHLIFRLTWAAD